MMPGHVHHIQLEASRVEPLDLLVDRDEHFATLMAALLATRFLILDVIAGYTHFDEATDEIPHVSISAVARVGIGDDERPVVVLRRGRPLGVRHPRSGELLVLVGRQQRANDRGGLVGNLTERIAGQVRSGIFVNRTFGRGGPPAKVNALDADSFHHDGLPRRVGAERRDRPFGPYSSRSRAYIPSAACLATE